ncbi:universal stress protein [Kiloniella sp. b19]|uniref:universal stress protein n=1 Tax=Kiloniella sp. GXU_MW_B19 TaxID=3141326 RepID=UPI0031CDF034
MSLKSILVHLANDDEHTRRLDIAKVLAKRSDALIHALFITTPTGMPAEIYGRGASVQFLIDTHKAAEKTARALEKEFDDYCDKEGIEHLWSTQEGDHLKLMTQKAHAADLIIASQPEMEHFEDRFRAHLTEELALHSGLPTLMIPREFDTSRSIATRILVVWRSTRESLRAVRDSLCMLQDADEVLLVSVQSSKDDTPSLHEAENYLKRHGVNVSLLPHVKDDSSSGSAIHKLAQKENCDLIVIGAFTHSRLRDFFMGLTRYLVKKSKIPVLLSH